MGALLSLSRWGPSRSYKLDGPVRVARNQLTRGICSLFYPTSATGAIPIDLITGNLGSLSGGAVLNVGPFGRQLDVSGGGTRYATITGRPMTTGHITVAGWVIPQVTSRGDIFTRWHNGANSADQFWLAYGVAASKPQFGFCYGSNQQNTGTTGVTGDVVLAKPNLLVGFCNGAVVEVYLNGVLAKSASASSNDANHTASAAWLLGNNINGDGQLNGQILGAAAWNRELHATEIACLGANFNQLVEAA